MSKKCVDGILTSIVVILFILLFYTSITFAKDLPAKQYFRNNVFTSEFMTIPTYRVSNRIFAVQSVDKKEVLFFEFNQSMDMFKIYKSITLYKNGAIETKLFESKFSKVQEHTLVRSIIDSCIINHNLIKSNY